ncbi:MAG: transposase family protein [Herminiimonas sp.]|nr:transposase family protein [Herminiimonas sp.]
MYAPPVHYSAQRRRSLSICNEVRAGITIAPRGNEKESIGDEQIARMLREVDKDPVLEVAERAGRSEQSICGWPKHFSGTSFDDVKELKNVTLENAHLKKLLAERDHEIEIMKRGHSKKVVSAPARRAAAF